MLGGSKMNSLFFGIGKRHRLGGRKAAGVGALLFVLVLLFSLSAGAQSFRGSIRGVVRDAHGAVVVAAKVTAKERDTELQRTATTGSDGVYVFVELPAGIYTLTAQ